jgi:hypothetical protein
VPGESIERRKPRRPIEKFAGFGREIFKIMHKLR